MSNYILEVYELGLEKYAGDEQKAKEFTIGFMKEAAGEKEALTFGGNVLKGAAGAIGTGLVGLGLGLGIHGISSTLRTMNEHNLRGTFQAALNKAVASNPILVSADKTKVQSYGETVFKFPLA